MYTPWFLLSYPLWTTRIISLDTVFKPDRFWICYEFTALGGGHRGILDFVTTSNELWAGYSGYQTQFTIKSGRGFESLPNITWKWCQNHARLICWYLVQLLNVRSLVCLTLSCNRKKIYYNPLSLSTKKLEDCRETWRHWWTTPFNRALTHSKWPRFLILFVK